MMELIRKNYLVAAVIAGVVFGLFFGLLGKSQRSEKAAPPASAIEPAPGELRHAVAAIFARNASGRARGARIPLSQAFVDDKVMFGRFLEIAGATDVRPRVDAVHGRNVDITIGYALVSDMKVKMLFTRRDTWRFTHANAGWLLDGITVNDNVLRGLDFPDGSRENVARSSYDRASRAVTFSMRGRWYVWTPDARWGWKIVALASPKPTPTAIARTTPAPSPSPSASNLIASQTPTVATPTVATTAKPRPSPTQQPSATPSAGAPVATRTPPSAHATPTRASAAAHPAPATHSPSAARSPTATRTPIVAQIHSLQVAHANPARNPRAAVKPTTPAPAAVGPYDDCSTETIDGVSEDGSFVTLADGRRYRVRESQRDVSSLWIAGDEVTVCDPGPSMDARLTHRGEIVYAAHPE
jgi:hypothetical protein